MPKAQNKAFGLTGPALAGGTGAWREGGREGRRRGQGQTRHRPSAVNKGGGGVRAGEQERRGVGKGVWNPKVCVPK